MSRLLMASYKLGSQWITSSAFSCFADGIQVEINVSMDLALSLPGEQYSHTHPTNTFISAAAPADIQFGISKCAFRCIKMLRMHQNYYIFATTKKKEFAKQFNCLHSPEPISGHAHTLPHEECSHSYAVYADRPSSERETTHTKQQKNRRVRVLLSRMHLSNLILLHTICRAAALQLHNEIFDSADSI